MMLLSFPKATWKELNKPQSLKLTNNKSKKRDYWKNKKVQLQPNLKPENKK